MMVKGGLVLAGAVALATGFVGQSRPVSASRGELPAFESDAALRTFISAVQRRRTREMASTYDMAVPAPAVATPAMKQGSSDNIVVTGAKATSITNNQEAGVDEGGIVKQRGDTLIVLRRGRLFTVSLAGGRMRAIDAIDAFPPGAGVGNGAWYDEMLLLGDRVVVIGFQLRAGRNGGEPVPHRRGRAAQFRGRLSAAVE